MLEKPIGSFTGEFDFLSNFFEAPYILDGVWFRTVEHGYQSEKALTEAEKEFIRSAGTPGQAKRRGKKVAMRSDWEDVKLTAMMVHLTAKFTQHPELGERLLATGDRTLIEGNTWGDKFWGVCDGKGLNWLGRCLMIVRDPDYLAFWSAR